MKARLLEEAVIKCQKCAIIEKPFAKYSAYSKWLPQRVKTLAVGESPPPGQKNSFFYNLESFDRLRLSLKLMVGELRAEDIQLLKTLFDRGVFITASIKCRPPSRKALPEMRKNCVWMLKKELNLLKPKRLVAMGRYAAESVHDILGIEPPKSLLEVSVCRIDDLEVVYTPHPNYIFRFGRRLAPKVREHLFE